jgi:hypothetical protein
LAPDLELCSEYVWVEIRTVSGIHFLIGNNYFLPGAKPEDITDYFHGLESIPDTSNFRIICLGDWDVPRFNWESGSFCLTVLNIYSQGE